jgi:chitin synthase
MSYNRLDDDYYGDPMDRRGAPYRSPSPGGQHGGQHGQHGYQLEENPFNNSHAAVDMPLQPPPGRYGTPGDHSRYGSPMDPHRLGTPGDHLAMNAAVRPSHRDHF